jgi:Methyltransferase domain
LSVISLDSRSAIDYGAAVGLAKEAARRTGAYRLRWVRKARTVRRYGHTPASQLGYVLLDPEVDNFTYEIANKDDLATWVDDLCGGGEFVGELDRDERIRRELDARTLMRPSVKRRMRFGRRLGWYAIVRALEPDVVAETGTHDGLGSVALLAALARNGGGTLVSIDPKPGSGWLVPERLRDRWQPVRATSYDALKQVGKIDVFLHDSLHTYECESWELRTVADMGVSMLMTDNPGAPCLTEVASSLGVEARFWVEQPIDHWYPGGGIGAARLH